MNKFLSVCLTALLLCLHPVARAQQQDADELKRQLQAVTAGYRATAGLAVTHLEKGGSVMINDGHHFPMQSVYKFPLALAVLHRVDEGRLSLDRKVPLTRKDLKEDTWSPMKEKFPDGKADLTVKDLLGYAISESDNIACDLLFGLVGGPDSVGHYIHSLGVTDIAIVATEKEMHRRWDVQYNNWCRPSAMTGLLRGLFEGKYLTAASNRLLMQLMEATTTGPERIRGLLPMGVTVAHKTGTSATNKKGIRGACNDVGIITLPDGRHLALTVFVSDSRESLEADERLIATLSKAVYEYYRNGK